LVFVIVSVGLFWTFIGPALVYVAKYAGTQKDRNKWLTIALLVAFAFTDLPMFMCDITIVYYYGWVSAVQGISFVIRLISGFLGAVVTWFIYMWRLSKLLHEQIGGMEETASFGSRKNDGAPMPGASRTPARGGTPAIRFN
jgi:hypothetical protein